MKISGFDWDEWNSIKCRKHGVSISDIEQAFENQPTIRKDEKHSEHENRFLLVNKTEANRYVFIAFTFRFSLKGIIIRPISARFMHKKEVAKYGQKIS